MECHGRADNYYDKCGNSDDKLHFDHDTDGTDDDKIDTNGKIYTNIIVTQKWQ